MHQTGHETNAAAAGYTGLLVPLPTLQIFTAIRLEERAISRAFGAASRVNGPLVGVRSRFTVQISLAGLGGCRLPQLLGSEVRCVILVGLAGGLDPALAVGDLVLDSTEDLLRDEEVAPTRRGRILTVPAAVTSIGDKAELFRTTGALAVDMEGTAVRRLTDSAGIPWVHLRAISDASNDSLDPAILNLLDPLGNTRWGSVASYLVRHPARIPSLARLGQRASFAAGQLADELVRLLPLIAAAL